MALFTHQSRLARKLAMAAFAVSLVCALVSTGLLLFLEYRQEKHKILADIGRLGRTSAPGIAVGLWSFNVHLLKTQLNGLTRLPHIAYARVVYEDGSLDSGALPKSAEAVALSFALVKTDRDKSFDLGELTLCPDYGPLKTRLFRTGGRILMIQLFISFTIGLVLFVLFYTFVGRHLEAIAGQAKGLSPMNLDLPIALARTGGQGKNFDELDVLINAMNLMRINLKHSIKALRKADDRHRVLFETMHQGVVYHDQKEQVLSANPAALNILGGTMDQLLGKRLDQVDMEWVREDLSPYPLREHPVRVALDRGRQVTGAVAGIRKPGQGAWTWLSVTATPLFRGGEDSPYLIHVTFEDITRAKADEKILHRYEQILSVTDDMMSFIDGDYLYRAVNDAYLRAHGKDREEIVGRSVEELMGPEVFSRLIRPRLDRALNGETVSFQDWFDYPGVGRRYMRIIYHPSRGKVAAAHGVVVCVHDLTDIKEAESALVASELKYRLLFEHMAQGVFYQQADGRIVDFNPNALSMFGITADELMGRDSFDPAWHVIREDGTVCPPDSHPSMEALATGRPVGNAVLGVYNPKENSYRWLNINAIPQFRQGEDRPFQVFVTMHDITSLRRTEEALQASHERFLTVVNSLDAFIYVEDLETHEILFMNQCMRDHFGGDMTGRACCVAFKDGASPWGKYTGGIALDQTGPPSDTRVWTSRNGTSGRWYINQDKAISWTSGTVVRLHIATDITDLKNMENDLRQAQKMESIGTLAGGMAHDFNNILSIILGNAELGFDEMEPWHPAAHHIKEIKTASLRAKGVVQQLLNFSRKTDYAPVRLDLARMLKESMTLLRSSIPSHIELRSFIHKGEYPVLADPSQMHQVFMNLCTNAYQAMAEAGGIIDLTLKPLHIADGRWRGLGILLQGDYLELGVADNGPGIPGAIAERIFDPYFTTKDVGQGTGLGLAVVQGIVQGHNGYIRVESRPGRGTAFFILFPAAAAGDGASDGETDDEEVAGGAGHILVVDDEAEVADVLRRFLERMGYQVDVETNPLSAAGLLAGEHHGYDLLITDMTMPSMNGLALTEQVRRTDPDLPVIICTGHNPNRDDRRAEALKIAAYAMKPVTLSDISKLVSAVLAESREAGA